MIKHLMYLGFLTAIMSFTRVEALTIPEAVAEAQPVEIQTKVKETPSVVSTKTIEPIVVIKPEVKKEVSIKPKPQLNFDDKDVKCLADNIYHEARGSTKEDQKAVALVVLNRMNDNRWKQTLCSVVWQHAQFSWTLNSRLWNIKEPSKYEEIYNFAKQFLEDTPEDITNGANHYYNPKVVKPRWSRKAISPPLFIGRHLYLKL